MGIHFPPPFPGFGRTRFSRVWKTADGFCNRLMLGFSMSIAKSSTTLMNELMLRFAIFIQMSRSSSVP